MMRSPTSPPTQSYSILHLDRESEHLKQSGRGGVRNTYRCNKSDWMCNTSSLRTHFRSYDNNRWHSTTFQWNNILRGNQFKDSRMQERAKKRTATTTASATDGATPSIVFSLSPVEMAFDSPSVVANSITSWTAILTYTQEPTDHLRVVSRFVHVFVSGSTAERLKDGVWIFDDKGSGMHEVLTDGEDGLDPNHEENGQETRQH